MKTKPYRAHQYLTTNVSRAAYLQAALESGSEAEAKSAVHSVLRSLGVVHSEDDLRELIKSWRVNASRSDILNEVARSVYSSAAAELEDWLKLPDPSMDILPVTKTKRSAARTIGICVIAFVVVGFAVLGFFALWAQFTGN